MDFEIMHFGGLPAFYVGKNMFYYSAFAGAFLTGA